MKAVRFADECHFPTVHFTDEMMEQIFSYLQKMALNFAMSTKRWYDILVSHYKYQCGPMASSACVKMMAQTNIEFLKAYVEAY